MSARKSPGDLRGAPAGGDLRVRDRNDAIIGHRLPNGQVRVHAPTAPCALCGTGVPGQV